MPCPNPEAAPVMSAYLPASRWARLAMPRYHRLQGGERAQGFHALFATEARTADATERQLHAAGRAVVIEEDLACPEPVGQAHQAGVTRRPYSRDQPKWRAV